MNIVKKIELIVFLIICILVLNVVSTVSIPAANLATSKYEYKPSVYTGTLGMNEMPADSQDVLFIGSSHIYCSVIPIELWGEYGLSAYNLTSSSQCSWTSYYYLKEALKKQHPKMVVCDLWGLFCGGNDEISDRSALDYIPFSFNKIVLSNIIWKHHIEDENYWSYLFPLLRYHTRWNELSGVDFAQKQLLEDYSHGYDMRYWMAHNVELTEANFPWKTQRPTNEMADYSEECALYYNKMSDLCKKEGVELLFIMTPVADYTLQMHNSAKKVADESDVVFVDFNTVEMQEKMNYDYNTDTLDTGHLNYKGAHKFTELIGDILTHTYNVSRSSDERDYLNSDLKMFKRQIAANELSITSSAYELIDKLNDSNYNVIWNGTDSSDENIATLVGGSFGGDWQSFWRCEAIEKSEHYYVGQFENNIDYIVDESGIHASGNLNVSNELGLCYMVYDNVLGKIVDKGKIQQDGAIIRD